MARTKKQALQQARSKRAPESASLTKVINIGDSLEDVKQLLADIAEDAAFLTKREEVYQKDAAQVVKYARVALQNAKAADMAAERLVNTARKQ